MQMTDGRSAYRQEGEQMSEQDEWAGEREQ
ncbi:hypothetical protein LZK46_08620, partial [Pseudomonas aeruginosa]|nr:hypothetical protein [Pseudomonas aeruginosa]